MTSANDQARVVGDIERRTGNIARMGTVEEVTHSPPRVRVRMGGLLSAPIPWLVGAASATKVWSAPAQGEQVMVLAPSGELAQGVVLRGVYSDANPPPSDNPDAEVVVFPDGSRVEWVAGTITVSAVTRVVVDCADIRLGSAGANDPVVRRSDLQAAFDQFLAQYNAHTHPVAGSATTAPLSASVTAQGSPVTSTD